MEVEKLSEEKIADQAAKIIRAHGLKRTPQRLKILIYLMTHHNHPTAEMIFNDISLSDEKTGIATVYNTLNTFVDLGFVIEINNGSDGSTHYDFFAKPHFHVICTNCGKIADVEYTNFDKIESKMRQETEKQTGYITRSSHIKIYGLCPDCQKLEK